MNSRKPSTQSKTSCLGNQVKLSLFVTGHLAMVESGGLIAFQTMSVVIPGVAGIGFGFVKACVQDEFGMSRRSQNPAEPTGTAGCGGSLFLRAFLDLPLSASLVLSVVSALAPMPRSLAV